MNKIYTPTLFLIFFLLFRANALAVMEFTNDLNENCNQPIIAPAGILFLDGSNEIKLSAQSGFSNYQWFKNDVEIEGAREETLMISTSGFYKVEIGRGTDCKRVSDVSEVIDVSNNDPLPFENLITPNGTKTDAGFNLCEGESLIITAQGNFTGYVWSGGENNLTSSVSITEPGTYQVAARITQDCALTQTFTVTAYEAPSVKVEVSDSEFREGEWIYLNATGADKFSWFPTEGLDNPFIANPTASPGRTITYTVTGTSTNGCTHAAEVTLYLENDKVNIVPPKVFSANRDEFYIIDNIEDYPSLEIVIFNRQGVEVFKARPYFNNWDATYKGSALPKGDYYFVMRGEGDKNLKTGSILLLR